MSPSQIRYFTHLFISEVTAKLPVVFRLTARISNFESVLYAEWVKRTTGNFSAVVRTDDLLVSSSVTADFPPKAGVREA